MKEYAFRQASSPPNCSTLCFWLAKHVSFTASGSQISRSLRSPSCKALRTLVVLVATAAAVATNTTNVLKALQEGERRLREICDPDAVNETCFANQKQRVEQLGGEEACLNAYSFNHTPTPTEQNEIREGLAL